MKDNNIKQSISLIWEEIIKEINLNPKKFPSEKTMVFRFAWLLQKKRGIEIDYEFERIVLKDDTIRRKIFLDLFFELENLKIGIEFKFPKKSEKASNNQTQTRKSIIRDIDRLNKMVKANEIDIGVFLIASDLKAYAYDSGKRIVSNDFKIHHIHNYENGKCLPSFEQENHPLICNVCFEWVGIENIKPKEVFAFVKPIFLVSK